MDCLVMGSFMIEKGKLGDYKEEIVEEQFELD